MSDTNPLFQGFQPQAIDAPQLAVKENPFTGEKTGKKPRKAKAAKPPKAAKPAKTPHKPRAEKPEPSIVRPVEPKITTNLQTLFAAMKGLHEEDHDLFEKLLAASPASRKRVFVAIAKIFP